MLRRDEVNRDNVGNQQQHNEFEYYKKFMHSGVSANRNANLVKKYIKLNYNDWSNDWSSYDSISRKNLQNKWWENQQFIDVLCPHLITSLDLIYFLIINILKQETKNEGLMIGCLNLKNGNE